MDSISMEVKLISGKDLKAFNFFQKLTIYAQVSIASDEPDKKLGPDQKQQKRSPTDKEGDGNPEWNHQMRFELSLNEDFDHLFLHFELFHEGVIFGDKPIGEVRVPIKGLIQESGGVVRFVSYQVRSPDEKPNGVLDFSFKVNGNRTELGTDFPAMPVSGHTAGFPAAHNHVHLHHHHHHHHQQQQQQQQSSHSLYPQVEVDHGGPPLVYYPPSASSPYPPQEGYYPPPETYYPRQPPPPPMLHPLHAPKSPPGPPSPHPVPILHGAYYSPQHPHGLHHWGSNPHLGAYDYGAQGSPWPGSGQQAWPGGWNGLGSHHSSSWNGR